MQNTLFNDKTIKTLISNVKLTTKQKGASEKWLDLIEKGDLLKEKGSYLKFYDIILKELLGYDDIEYEKEGVEFSYEKNGKSIVRIEAKGMNTKDLFLPQKRIKEESPVQQLWRYMNSHATPYGIVTNYKIFILFKYDVGSTKYYSFDFEHIKENTGELKKFVAIFSREGIDNGFVEKVYEKSIVEEREFTKEFYKLFHETRLMMVKEFEENSKISRIASVHFSQLFLNRLMFVFFVEDTGKLEKRTIEDRMIKMLERNQDLLSNQSRFISDLIVTLFNELNKGNPPQIFGFNGGLFEYPIPLKIFFKDFRDDRLFKDVYQHSKFKNKILELNEKEQDIINKYKNKLNPIIKNIFLMASFDFSTEVNVNILGHIFEQSISDIEDLKENGDSRRKKEGVYYTPEYITDYICRNTIIPYLSKNGATTVSDLISEYSKNIEELENKFKETKILDPACGSGAFLIKAVDIMLEIFKLIQDFKQQEGEYEQKEKGLKIKRKDKEQIVLAKWNEEDEAREIIENSIYGVDINEESIGITKLSLFLKMARKNRKLTNLSNNIKQGNSLIDDKNVDERAFDWNKEFPFKFDVIIGNPPYGAKLSEKEVAFVKKEYSVGNSETAQLMMEKAYSLLKDNGHHGFIIPKPFIFASTWNKIRNKFLDELNVLIDCKKVWKEVKLEQIIYTLEKGKKANKYNSGIRDNQSIKIIANINKSLISKFDGVLLNSLSNKEIKIGIKMNEIKNKLNDFCINRRGMILNKFEEGGIYEIIGGNEISRYGIKSIRGTLNSDSRLEEKSKVKSNSVLVQGIVAHIENPQPHIKITACVPDRKDVFIVDNINQLICNKEVSNKFVSSILNSKLINWYCYKFIYCSAIRTMRFDNPVTNKIPMPKIFKKEQENFIEKSDLMLKLNKEFYEKKDKFLELIKHEYKIDKISTKLSKFHDLGFDEFMKQLKIKLSIDKKSELLDFFEKNKIEVLEILNKIKKIDREIDEMVYKLYGITKEEQKIIEGGL